MNVCFVGNNGCMFVWQFFLANGYWSEIFYSQYPGGACAPLLHESKLKAQPGLWFGKRNKYNIIASLIIIACPVPDN